MGFFFRKKASDEFLYYKNLVSKLDGLFALDNYISYKQYKDLFKEFNKFISKINGFEKENLLTSWCKNNNVKIKDVEELKTKVINSQSKIDQHNEKFINRKLKEDKVYLDNVLKDDDPKIKLDEEQRKVVLSDEDYTLVVAGAGAGKTTTIEAKAKYLVEKKHMKPERIMIISFTNEATNELKNRFKKLNLNCRISTFHSIGNSIIKDQSGQHSIGEDSYKYSIISKYLVSLAKDASFIQKINLFFCTYLNSNDEFSKNELLFKEQLSRGEIETLKSELNKFKESVVKSKKTINNEFVKSYEECSIANFLYLNGIEYEYESIYKYNIPNSLTPYRPDFKIKQNGKVAYIEHFGVTENFKSNRYNADQLKQYVKRIYDKRIHHKNHGTTLIETYSRYNDGESLITHLKNELIKNGFLLEQRPQEEVYNDILASARDRYFSRLVALITTFIHHFKVNEFDDSKFNEFMTSAQNRKDERSKLFLGITNQVYLHYSETLKKDNRIDFEDMISKASKILDEYIRVGKKLDLDYIIIDEYQDISFQRFNLAEKLSKCSEAKILAVGDDWQSIYRFSGSEISLFNDFEKRMPHSKLLFLTNTYRNSQELIDIAGSFIMKNDFQRKKSLHSPKHIEDPVSIYSYYYKTNKKEGNEEIVFEKALNSALEDISKRNPKANILLIARYNFEKDNILKLTNIFTQRGNGEIIWNKNKNINIKFLTAHGSKGLTFDEVILLNGNGGKFGFPSQVENDPVMKFVIKDPQEIEFAEERRLFYVALTRTKNKVYILSNKQRASKFVLELEKNNESIHVIGPELDDNENGNFKYTCPYCGYPLQYKKAKYDDEYLEGDENKKIYVCTNDPEICGFETNNLRGGKLAITKCPKCYDGYLVVKKTKEDNHYFLGCTHYKKDGCGCNFTITSENFAFNNIEKMGKDKYLYSQKNELLPLDSCILCGLPIKTLLSKLNSAIKILLTKNINFTFGKTILLSFLLGEKDSKAISSFRLYEEKKYFGMIDEKYKHELSFVLDVLQELGSLVIDENSQYKNYIRCEIEESDQFARLVFQNFVK